MPYSTFQVFNFLSCRYVSNTRIKFILAVDDPGIKDEDLRGVCVMLRANSDSMTDSDKRQAGTSSSTLSSVDWTAIQILGVLVLLRGSTGGLCKKASCLCWQSGIELQNKGWDPMSSDVVNLALLSEVAV
jgi:hypothetical protein